MNEEVPTLDPLFPNELFDNRSRENNTSPFSFGEITSALESLQNGRATDSDNIAAEALKVPALRQLILSSACDLHWRKYYIPAKMVSGPKDPLLNRFSP